MNRKNIKSYQEIFRSSPRTEEMKDRWNRRDLSSNVQNRKKSQKFRKTQKSPKLRLSPCWLRKIHTRQSDCKNTIDLKINYSTSEFEKLVYLERMSKMELALSDRMSICVGLVGKKLSAIIICKILIRNMFNLRTINN